LIDGAPNDEAEILPRFSALFSLFSKVILQLDENE